MRIAVAGATGVVGQHVVAEAEANGHEVVPLSRRQGVDVCRADLAALTARLEGVEAVIDCLSIVTTRGSAAVEFFTKSTRHLLAAERQVGLTHHVALSIVGIDEAPTGYYAGKVAQERAIVASGQPYTILRATQFHEFAGQMLERTKLGPLVIAPKMLSAPIAAREVAAVLVELAEGAPVGGTRELGGPERRQMVDLMRAVAGRAGTRGRIVPVPLPGAGGRAMRDGALVPRDPWRRGSQTFEAWLDEQWPPSRTAPPGPGRVDPAAR